MKKMPKHDNCVKMYKLVGEAVELNSTQGQFVEQLYLDRYYPLFAYALSALRDKSLAE